jgi:hypothetical protein
MKPADWELIESLYDSASALPAAERERFLVEHCHGDTGLMEEVLAMLEAADADEDRDRTISYIVGSAAAIAAESAQSDWWTGRRIGPYQVVRPIGSGGMGAVFLAVRADDQYRKEVALKTLRFETSDAVSSRRFRHERQILASLDHPNIARLLDGGATDEGMPWLVMEYVQGVSLIAYCQNHNLSLEKRIELFCLVCDAVQFAHQKLIVHRDIKPGNILVSDNGEPKLLDFGIAKLLEPTAGGANTSPRTATGLLLMTPDYASPEQVRGEAVTTSTDVYALGAVLYELLTGQRPHALRNYDPGEIANAICKVGVSAPSRAGGSRFRGDLDNIVLKATHQEPARRYTSAGQLAEDLRRYLRFLPVIARPDTLVYRTTKYVRRNWVVVSALTAVILALAAGIVAERREARIAEQRFQQVRTLSHRFIFDFNDQIRAVPGTTSVRVMMVNTALEYLDNLSRGAGSDPDLQWELAQAYEKVADAQGSPAEPSLGKAEDAIRSYRKSIDMQEELLHRGLLTGSRRVSLAHTYSQLALVYRATNQTAEALKAAEASVLHAGAVSEKARLKAMTNLAFAQSVAGKPAEALKTDLAIEAAYVSDAENEKGWGPAHNSLAALCASMSRTLVRLGRYEESIPYYRRSIALREARLAEPAFDSVNARDLILNYQSIADALGAGDRFSMGKTDEAVVWYQKALDLSERLAAADSKNASARIEVARSAGKFGAAIQNSDPARALVLFRKALSESEGLLPPGAARDEMRAAAYRSMAVPLDRLHRSDEARQMLRNSLRIDEEALSRTPKSYPALSNVAEDWLARGDVERAHDPAAAEAAYRKGLELAYRTAAHAPGDFTQFYSQVRALEGLAALQGRNGDAAPKRRLRELWAEWGRRQPDSPFIQQRLRELR